MIKFFSFLLVLLSFAVPLKHLHADIYELSIAEEVSFVFEISHQWNMADATTPFDYKVAHEDRNCEYHLMLSAFDGGIEDLESEVFLKSEMFESGIALYGDAFWSQPNFTPISFETSPGGVVTFAFLWDTGDKIDNVLLLAYQRGKYSTACISIVDHLDRDNYEDCLVESFKFMLETCLDVLRRMTCFEKS